MKRPLLMLLNPTSSTKTLCVNALALSLFLANAPAWAMGKAPPQRVMVALGDSMTAGTFANTTSSPGRRGGAGALSASELQPEVQTVSGQASTRDLLKFLLKPVLENKNTYSWATGRRIPSHFERLRDVLRSRGESVEHFEALNFSVPGSKSLQILEQARKLRDELRSRGNPRIEYLAMTIGANDVCDSTMGPVVPDAEFESTTREVFAQIAATARSVRKNSDERIRVLVAGIPPIPTSGGPEFWQHQILPGLTCETIRKRVFPFCPNLIRWNSEVEFEDRMNQVARKNAILERLVHEANERNPELEMVFGSGLAEVRFAPEDLAMDCFHPNAWAQKRMSEELWRNQPWY